MEQLRDLRIRQQCHLLPQVPTKNFSIHKTRAARFVQNWFSFIIVIDASAADGAVEQRAKQFHN